MIVTGYSRVFSSGPAPELTLVYDTSLAAGEDIEIPMFGTVNCTVDWGDSTSDSYTTTGIKVKTYAGAGTYTVKITGTLTGFGYQNATGTAARVQKLTQCTSFGTIGLTSLHGAFRGATNLTVAPSVLPAGVTNLQNALRECTSLNDSRISGWDTSAVTNLPATFFGSTSFNQPLPWNTANVTAMSNTLQNCTAFNQTLASWNTVKVTNMNSMLAGATNFNGAGVSGFNLVAFNADNRLNLFAQNCTFSTANYDAILIAWDAAKAGYRTDLAPSFGSSKYSAGAAATARAALVTYGWTISDAGEAP